MSCPARLDERSLRQGLGDLARRDPVLEVILRERGAPALWRRPAGWRTLARIILEQQISLSSARAAWRRLNDGVQPFSAATLARTSEARLRGLGLTRQKSRYLRGLATAVVDGSFNAAALAAKPDDEVRAGLVALHGVGKWTADCYLLLAMCRADVWPSGDVALRQAIAERYGIPRDGNRQPLTASWRPWRSVAARLLWHDYLSKRGAAVTVYS